MKNYISDRGILIRYLNNLISLSVSVSIRSIPLAYSTICRILSIPTPCRVKSFFVVINVFPFIKKEPLNVF